MIFHLLHGAPHYNITLFSTPFSLEIKAETKGLLGMSRGVRSILLDNFSTHWHIFLQHAIRCSVLIMLSAHHHVFVQCVGNVHVVFSFSVLGTTWSQNVRVLGASRTLNTSAKVIFNVCQRSKIEHIKANDQDSHLQAYRNKQHQSWLWKRTVSARLALGVIRQQGDPDWASVLTWSSAASTIHNI